MAPNDTQRVYWPSRTGLDLAEEADRRVESFYSGLENSFIYHRWARSYRVFYGLAGEEDPFDIGKAGLAGDRGQLTSIKVNHAGNLARHSVALISQTVPEFEPIPANNDYETLKEVDWVKRALAYYMDTRGVGEKLYETAQGAAIFGVSYLIPEWDPLAGSTLAQPAPIGPPPAPGEIDKRPVRTKTGDLAFRVFTPLDLVLDRFRYDQDHDWFISRRFVSRFDLAARYPAFADQILDFQPSRRLGGMVSTTNRLEAERQFAKEIDSDLLPLYTLFHRKTDALPQGKYACFLGADILLYEGNLPYEEVPCIPVCAGKILRSPHGESGLHHITGMQETYDNVVSSVTTNNVAAGTQIIMVPEECDYTIDEVLEGLAVLRYRSGPEGKLLPQALNLTAPNGEALKYLQLIRGEMETVSGVPSTVRGAPQANVASGSFGALISQQAMTYMSAFQYSFQQAVGRTGDLIVSILKQYADQDQLIEVVGKDQAYEVATLNKDKFKNIHRVTVKSGNPATRTPEFNQAMAEKLLGAGIIKDPKEFLLMVRTGQLDTVVGQEESELMNIRQENDLLAQGRVPPVLATDNHREHIFRNKQPLDSPAARNDPAVAQAVLEHLMQHINALRTTDPALLQILGQTPLPPVAQSGVTAPPAPPMAPQGGPPGVPGAQPGPNPVPPPPPPTGAMPHLPLNPKNPMTGNRWTPGAGGLPPTQ